MAAGDRVPYEPGTNVLVLADALGDAKGDACDDLLAVDAPERLDVLRITYSQEADEVVSEWRRAHGDLPARTGIVRVGDQASLTGRDPDAADMEGVAVTTANPNDVTGLGMRLNNYLGDHDPDLQLVVCFDSLTQMLQFTDVQSAFKFVHMFTGQLREVDAIAHFHMDPSAHDPQTVSRLKPAFDEGLQVDD
jgi:hypothetical protein